MVENLIRGFAEDFLIKTDKKSISDQSSNETILMCGAQPLIKVSIALTTVTKSTGVFRLTGAKLLL